MSKKSSESKKPLKITDLNTDCFMKIFEKLDYTDLYHVSKSNKVFTNAVNYVASAGSFELQISAFNQQGWKEMKQIDNFVRAFGSRISHLSIKLPRGASECAKLMCKHLETLIETNCRGGNVRHWSFERFKVDKQFLSKNKKMFKALDFLEIVESLEDNDLLWLMNFALANEIKGLRYYGGKGTVTTEIFKKIAASKLETCILRVLSKDQISDQIPDLPINCHLKRLDLFNVAYNPAHLASFPNLEILEGFRYKNHPLKPILLLPKLKSLHLSYKNNQFLEIAPVLMKLAKLSQLETLGLDSEGYDLEEDELQEEREDIQDRNNDFLAYVRYIRDKDDDLALEYEDCEFDFGQDDDDEDEDEDDCKATRYLLANILCKMTSLKTLHLGDVAALRQHFPRIGASLKELRKLHIDSLGNNDQDVVKDTIKKLKTLVKETTQLIYLHVEYDNMDIKGLYGDLVKIRKSQKNEQILHVHFPYHGFGDDRIRTTAAQEKYVIVTYGL